MTTHRLRLVTCQLLICHSRQTTVADRAETEWQLSADDLTADASVGDHLGVPLTIAGINTNNKPYHYRLVVGLAIEWSPVRFPVGARVRNNFGQVVHTILPCHQAVNL